MLRINTILFFILCLNYCFGQGYTVVCGTIKNFFPENFEGKLNSYSYHYNPKSEQQIDFTPQYLTADSFYLRIIQEQPFEIKIFSTPLFLVPGDSVHLKYIYAEDSGLLISSFFNVSSAHGVPGNVLYPVFFREANDSIRRTAYRLKDEQNIIPEIDSMFAELTSQTRQFLLLHKVSGEYEQVIRQDLLLSEFVTKMDYFTHQKKFDEALQLISNNLSLFEGKTFNTVPFFSAIGSFQDVLSSKYNYEQPQNVLKDISRFLKGDNYVYASLIYANVLRQQLPDYNNPYTTQIALDALENTRDNDLIIFANYILNQEAVNEKTNELLKQIEVEDPQGKRLMLGDVLRSNRSKLKFIDLWASWCAPCIEGIPASRELPDRFSLDTIQVFFISIDSDHNAWKAALKKLDLLSAESYIVADRESLKRLEDAVHLKAIPHYLLLDAENKMQVLRAPSAKNIDRSFLLSYIIKNEGEKKPAGTPPPPPSNLRKKI